MVARHESDDSINFHESVIDLVRVQENDPLPPCASGGAPRYSSRESALFRMRAETSADSMASSCWWRATPLAFIRRNALMKSGPHVPVAPRCFDGSGFAYQLFIQNAKRVCGRAPGGLAIPVAKRSFNMNDLIAHSGAWPLSIIMIVVVSWMFYRYFAPKNWREWAGAGVVQAFIIALYAEMYGFPLTIYLLVRFFGVDRGNLNANLWSTLLGMGETGMVISMIVGYALVFLGIGLFAEGWRELYRAREQKRLAIDGLYGLVRHPQYLGLYLGLFGEGIVH